MVYPSVVWMMKKTYLLLSFLCRLALLLWRITLKGNQSVEQFDPCWFPFLSSAFANSWECLLRLAFWTGMLDASSRYFGKMDFSNSFKSLFKLSFLLLKISNMSTSLCPLCFSEEMQKAQIGFRHCSQWSSHCFRECCGHFGYAGVNPLCLSGTTLWSFVTSEICVSTQSLQRLTWQMSQCMGAMEPLHKVQRTASWALYRGSIVTLCFNYDTINH